MYKTREEVENWLIKMNIKNYIINEDLTVNVNGVVVISFKKLKKIPINFGVINGGFYCNNNELTSLEGCPKEVTDDFNCSDNRLTSLEECPKVVNGNFYCYDNRLTSLEECPEIIKGHFNCYNNKLTSLDGCPKEVIGDFNCGSNELTSLKGCPEIINGNYDCYKNKLKNLEYFPKEINGEFIYMNENDIAEEELVNFHCNIANTNKIYSDFDEKGNKEEFLEKVDFYKIKRENELLREINKNSNNIKLSKKI